MTTFVHVDQPVSHPGVDRATAVAQQLREARGRLNGARGLGAGLLAVVVAAMLVVADRMITELDEGEMLAGWAMLSALLFVVLALGANAASRTAGGLRAAWQRGAARRAQKRSEAQFMAYAQFDPRVMADLQAAITRQQSELEAVAPVAPAAAAPLVDRAVPVSLYAATRRLRSAQYL